MHCMSFALWLVSASRWLIWIVGWWWLRQRGVNVSTLCNVRIPACLFFVGCALGWWWFCLKWWMYVVSVNDQLFCWCWLMWFIYPFFNSFVSNFVFCLPGFQARLCLMTFLWRVWSWLRTNAGGVLNTCKSNGKASACRGTRVANGWVTRGWSALYFGISLGNWV